MLTKTEICSELLP